MQDGLRVHEIDADLAVLQLPHHDIARQEQADLRVRIERSMGERGVAGPENSVRAALDTELGLEGRLDVDVAQDTESLLVAANLKLVEI